MSDWVGVGGWFFVVAETKDQQGLINLIFMIFQVTHLAFGETVDLYCDDCSANVVNVLFCAQLSQFDAE